ncbi:hypothetical protein CANCADRAFT_148580 [Tortispora caseinolytica NRRL Y-17796]|uniref:ENTH domain-containing protein n=1 Tax=Tortispora caseinolytica NRRL Y-17796 TaxID=767744 RepID=A0A1E4TD15_9ASCO|nr:hypothetical protein CANCADRAFT_148580 [Tortispora caseinolytica NRRL Y-17796]
MVDTPPSPLVNSHPAHLAFAHTLQMNIDKAVKGATKIKLAAPKEKYLAVLVEATYESHSATMAAMCRTLNVRIADSAWTVSFKALVVIHYLYRNGAPEALLAFISKNPKVVNFRNVPITCQYGDLLSRYGQYLQDRAKQYGQVHLDYIRGRSQTSTKHRLKTLKVESGLMRETECVLAQVKSLTRVKCLPEELTNDIAIMAFRYLISDLLSLYETLNEGVIGVLEHYFEMSRYDAERALSIYKSFVKVTDAVVQYLQMGRRFQNITHVSVPKLTHAPTSLVDALEDFLQDPNFDTNHRQYLAEKEARQRGSTTKKPNHVPQAIKQAYENKSASNTQTQAQADLIDFFDSIDAPAQPLYAYQTGVPVQATGAPDFAFQQQYTNQYANQQPVMVSDMTGMNPQMTGSVPGMNTQQPMSTGPQFSNPFAYSQQQQPQQLQQQPTYIQPQPQQQPAAQFVPQPTGANPFRQQNTGAVGFSQPAQAEHNPFTIQRTQSMFVPNTTGVVSPQTQSPMTLQSQPTGTNPFTRASSMPQAQPELRQQPTGANPFRQSMVQSQQPTFGGLENLNTVPIFPRQ